MEGVSGLAKLLFSGRLVALQEGKVRVKLLQKKGRVWYNLCIATVQIVRIKLPKIELEYGCTASGLLSNYSPEIEKKWQFNEIKVTFTNEFDKPIRVLNNLDVLLKDWEIFWESPIGEEIEIGVGESKAVYFSTDNTMYDGRDLAKIKSNKELNGSTAKYEFSSLVKNPIIPDVLFLYGEEDPVSEGVDKVIDGYRKLGIAVRRIKIEGMRHDVLHDMCSEYACQVITDFLE